MAEPLTNSLQRHSDNQSESAHHDGEWADGAAESEPASQEEARCVLVAEELLMAGIVGNRDPANSKTHSPRLRLVEHLHTDRLLPPCHKCVFFEDRSKPTDITSHTDSNIVGDADFLEHLFCHFSVVHILVWMPLESEFAVATRSY